MAFDSTARTAARERETGETRISLKLDLDGHRENRIATSVGMLDHLLDLITFWADMNLEITCRGDLHIDAHHLVEDTGLVFGAALLEGLRDRKGIERTGLGKIPMDESLAEVCLDLSGRPWLEWRGSELLPAIIAREEKDVWREFFKAIASQARMNLHINFLYGLNGHHLLESAAKGMGLALRQAVSRRGTNIKSTKGGLD